MSAPLFGKVAGAEVSDAQVRFANMAARAVVDRVVDRIGLKVAAAAADLSPSHLRQAIDQREGRNLDLQHHLAIMRFATDGERAEWLDAIGHLFGRKSAPIAPRTAEEKLAALEEKVQRRFGAAGAEIVDAERAAP
jgi:hypothetical protein